MLHHISIFFKIIIIIITQGVPLLKDSMYWYGGGGLLIYMYISHHFILILSTFHCIFLYVIHFFSIYFPLSTGYYSIFTAFFFLDSQLFIARYYLLFIASTFLCFDLILFMRIQIMKTFLWIRCSFSFSYLCHICWSIECFKIHFINL